MSFLALNPLGEFTLQGKGTRPRVSSPCLQPGMRVGPRSQVPGPWLPKVKVKAKFKVAEVDLTQVPRASNAGRAHKMQLFSAMAHVPSCLMWVFFFFNILFIHS